MVNDFAQAFERVDVTALVRLMDRWFGEASYTIESLFRDEQRRVLKRVLQNNLSEIISTFGKVYEHHLPIMRFLRHIHAPLPRPYQLTADLLFNTDLRWAFDDDDPNLDHIRKLVEDSTQWGVELPAGELGYRFAKMLRRYAERWRQTPEQLELLRGLAQGVDLAGKMPFEVDLWAPQNVWFEVGKLLLAREEEQAQAGSQSARDWLADYLTLGDRLKMSVEEAKKKLDQLLKAPTLAQLADQVWAQGRIPNATYRLQLTPAFTFQQAADLVPYLAELGISDCYTSPVLRARPGSTHGYDVTDHAHFNPELGGKEGFDALAQALGERSLGLILDIVPNHMGIGDPANGWWMDVLENGTASRHASTFDIDWAPVNPDLRSKVLLPILGDLYGKELESGRIKLAYDQGKFWLHYYQHRLPISAPTTSGLLEHCLHDLADRVGEVKSEVHELRSILTALKYLPPRKELSPDEREERYREKESIRRRLAQLTAKSSEVRISLERTLMLYNGTPGSPSSFDRLDTLINAQAYRPAFWRVAAEEINYRRFFDINELAAIRSELPEVFQATHALVLRLLIDGPATGLRIDHPDGLRDPTSYFRALQRAYYLGRLRRSLSVTLPEDLLAAQFDRLWDQNTKNEPRMNTDETRIKTKNHDLSLSVFHPCSSVARFPLYVVAEKILSEEEPLPTEWAVAGTTGYDFLVEVNALFVASENANSFDRIYREWTGERRQFREMVYEAKRRIMQLTMASEINSLAHRLDRITERNRRYRDFTLINLRFAIRETIAALPVYRTYITSKGHVPERDKQYIDFAVSEARRRNPGMADDVLEFLRDLLLLHNLHEFAEADRDLILGWVLRFQQMTGPIMAKGVEDTAFYRYNRLVTLNDVGGDPDHFGLSGEAFHALNRARQEQWPAAMLSTSTHDTKRSEDVRARLNALSELPGEWESALERWREWNRPHLGEADGQPAPSANDQYLLYQTLVGTWPAEPVSEQEQEQFRQRIIDYMLKAAKEAKVHTSWVNPNQAYDSAMKAFIERLLCPEDSGLEPPRHRGTEKKEDSSVPLCLGGSSPESFLSHISSFSRRVAYFGYFNSLSQVTLKLTCPGVPDIYQGCELWDFSLVDPDNRRLVDYERRHQLLGELRRRIDCPPSPQQLLESGPAGRAVGRQGCKGLPALARELVGKLADGKIKLYTLHQLLSLRRQMPDLFNGGSYEPLAAEGFDIGSVVAFARRWEGQALIVAVPCRIVRLLHGQENLPLGEAWGDGRLMLPADQQANHYRNVFTGERLLVEGATGAAALPLAQLFRDFPVAVLVREQ